MGTPAASGWVSRSSSLHALLALASLATFAVALRGSLIEWDDDINILDNARVQSLTADNLRWMFTDLEHAMRYKALSWLSWALVYRAVGSDGFGYHALSLALHVANAALVFDLFARLLPRARGAPQGPLDRGAAFVAAAAWALNPVRAEPVAWATALPYTQATLFALLAARFYVRSHEGAVGARWLSVGAFVLSLLTYPVALLLPSAILLLDLGLAPGARPRDRLARLAPHALAAAPALAAALAARWIFHGRWASAPALGDFGPAHRVMQGFYVWASFVWRPLVPSSLRPLYLELYEPFDAFEARFVASAAMVLSISAALAWRARRDPWLLGCWVGFLGLTVPVLGLTERPHFPAERYMYLGHIPLAFALALLLRRAAERHGWRAPSAVTAIALVAAGAVVAHRRVPAWRDTAAFSAAVRPYLRTSGQVAKFIWREGRALARRGSYAEAEARYSEAIRLNPSRREYLLSRAEARRALGRSAEAEQDLERYRQSAPTPTRRGP